MSILPATAVVAMLGPEPLKNILPVLANTTLARAIRPNGVVAPLSWQCTMRPTSP